MHWKSKTQSLCGPSPPLFLSKHNYLCKKCNLNAVGQLSDSIAATGLPSDTVIRRTGQHCYLTHGRIPAASIQGFCATEHRSPGFARATSRLGARQAKSAPSPQPDPAARPRAVTMRPCHRGCHSPVTWQPSLSRSFCNVPRSPRCPQTALPRNADALMSAFEMSLLRSA